MTTTKIIPIKDAAVAWPLKPVPFRYWEAVVQAIKRIVPDEAEQQTVYFDPDTKQFMYKHTLTAEEELVEMADTLLAFRNAVRRAMDLPPEESKKALRELVGA